jgi:hypothetical protein
MESRESLKMKKVFVSALLVCSAVVLSGCDGNVSRFNNGYSTTFWIQKIPGEHCKIAVRIPYQGLMVATWDNCDPNKPQLLDQNMSGGMKPLP